MQMPTCLLVLAVLADGGDATCAPDPVPPPSLASDIARIGAATMAFSLIHADVRGPLFREGSLSAVGRNLVDPIRSAVEGSRADEDPFTTNYVAHPVSWGAIGYYLRRQGHSRGTAFLVSQGHSLVWEYVLEGAYQRPSGRDLITNLVSSYVGILLAGGPAVGGASLELQPGTAVPTVGPGVGPAWVAAPSSPGVVTLRVRLSI